MTYQYKTLGLAAALALGAVFAFSPMKAEAATIYATAAEEIGDASGTRGTQNNRDIIDNALGSNFDTFFELGFGGVVEFQFGNPTGQKFFGPGSVVEITNGSTFDWPEAVQIEVGMKGFADSFVTAEPNPFTNTGADGSKTFSFAGTFDTVRLTDVTLSFFGDAARQVNGTGGFDVAAIGVTPAPIPLPASALLLLGGLGGLGGVSALRRRKQAA